VERFLIKYCIFRTAETAVLPRYLGFNISRTSTSVGQASRLSNNRLLSMVCYLGITLIVSY